MRAFSKIAQYGSWGLPHHLQSVAASFQDDEGSRQTADKESMVKSSYWTWVDRTKQKAEILGTQSRA